MYLSMILANTALTKQMQAKIATSLHEILTSDIAYRFGFGWRWIIGFHGNLFHDSTTRTVKYKQDGIMCIMWETTGADIIHIKVKKELNFSARQRDDIIQAYKKIASLAGPLWDWEEFRQLPEKMLTESYTNCLVNTRSTNGLSNQRMFWYIVISKDRATFAYTHFYYRIPLHYSFLANALRFRQIKNSLPALCYLQIMKIVKANVVQVRIDLQVVPIIQEYRASSFLHVGFAPITFSGF